MFPGSCVFSQAKPNCALRTSSIFKSPPGRSVWQALALAPISLRAPSEHFSQHVVLLVHRNERLQDNLAETPCLGRQKAEAVVDRGSRLYIFNNRSVDAVPKLSLKL